MLPIAGEPDWVDVLAILFPAIALAVGGYLLLQRGKNRKARGAGSMMIALAAGAFGAFAIVGYAFPALEDFRSTDPTWPNLLGIAVLWGIPVGALVLAFRALWSGMRSDNRRS